MAIRKILDEEFSIENLHTIFSERIAQSYTVGRDGIKLSNFKNRLDQELQIIHKNTFNRKYKFTSYKQLLILKGAKKCPREISIAGVRDRVTLRALTNILVKKFEECKPRVPHHFISEIKNYIKNLSDEYSFIQIDVENFYPSLVHVNLMKRLRAKIRNKEILALISGAIETPTGKVEKNKCGVPQGLSVSNILSSIYMRRIDKQFRSQFKYYRYVDDILIICKTENAKRIFFKIRKELEKNGLKIHPLEEGIKTKIKELPNGIEYLGYNLKPAMTSIRKSSFHAMIKKIASLITSAKRSSNNSSEIKKIARRINLKISGCFFNGTRYGFMFYFSKTDNIQQLKRLDYFVKREWKKAGLEKFDKPKTFVKTYYEIIFNLNSTKYIPRFDIYTREQKENFIADFEGEAIEEVKKWDEERINKRFLKLVKREVKQLERDVTPMS